MKEQEEKKGNAVIQWAIFGLAVYLLYLTLSILF